MQSRKIIDISLHESPAQFIHTLYIVLFTFDDATQKKVGIFGDELARILNKNFEAIDLKQIYKDGKFSGKFELEAYYKGYLGGLWPYREILDVEDVIYSFNKRGHLVGLDAKKDLLNHTIPNADDGEEKQEIPLPTTLNTSDQKENKKWITKSYNPKQYMFRSLYDKNNNPIYNAIEINCHSDDGGAYISYRLIGMDRKEASGTIRQADLPDVLLPHSVTEIMNDKENDTWLNHILDVTTKRGQTSADHIPPEKEHEDFYRPYVQPKGYLVHRGNRMVYDDSLWQHLRQAGLFAAKKVTDILCPTKQSHITDDQKRNNFQS
jgi:hypothetical protein